MPNRLLALLVVAISVQLAGTSAAEAVRRRAFVTSVSGTGDLGSWPDAGDAVGVEAGDAICRARAAAAGLPNADAYRAWLSTGATDAYCHLRGQTGKKASCAGTAGAAGPWYNAFGTSELTGGLDALTNQGAIYRPVLRDESGAGVPAATRYWTGTAAWGGSYIFGNYTCSGWDSAAAEEDGVIGRAWATAGWWTDFSRISCDELHPLLCLEPGASEVSLPRWAPGSIAFVTSATGTADLGSWPEADGATGLAAGDAICRTLATAANLPAPESFVAWLSTEAVDARDRVTSSGPFRRLDGFTIASSKVDLLDGVTSASIHVNEHGDYLTDDQVVWTGTEEHGLSTLPCGEWDVVDGFGGAGNAAMSRNDEWTSRANYLCGAEFALYCFSNAVVLFWDGFESGGDASRWSAAVAAP